MICKGSSKKITTSYIKKKILMKPYALPAEKRDVPAKYRTLPAIHRDLPAN